MTASSRATSTPLFSRTTDGTVYLVYGGGLIARMKDDMSGLAEDPKKPALLEPDTTRPTTRTLARRIAQCSDIGHEALVCSSAMASIT